jgi:glycosyltransferase involved in cell wall biosynthesis
MIIAFDAKRAFHNSTGLGNYSRDLIRGIDGLKDNVELILLDPKPGKGQRDWVPGNSKVLSPKRFWRKIHPVWRTTQSGRVAEKYGAQIYHGLSNELPTDLAKTNLRSVVTIHDLIFETHPHLFPKTDAAIYRRKFSTAAREADHVVCVSEFTRNLVCELYQIPKSKTSVIYQGCHPSFYNLSEAGENPIGKPYFLMVGRIEQRKNHEVAIRALAEIKASDAQLIIVGSKTSYTAQITKAIQELKLENRVHFRHDLNLSELQNYYQNAIGLLYPSHTEGFGIPILEAFLCGVPVITNKEGVFREAGGAEALYVDVNDASDLAEKMNEILSEEFDRQNIVLKAQERVRRVFSPKGQAEKYLALYRQMLS